MAHRRVGQDLLFAHLILVPLVFWTATTAWSVFVHPRVAVLRLTVIVLLTLAVDAALARRARPGRGREGRASRALTSIARDPLRLGIVLFAVSALVSTITSISPRISLRGDAGSFEGLGTLLAYTILFFLTRALCSTSGNARRLLLAPVIVAATAATYGLVQAAGRDPIPWQNLASFKGAVRPGSTLGHSLHLGVYLAMSLPLTVYLTRRAVISSQWGAVVAFAATIGVSVVAIVLTLSRGTWLAVAVGSTVLAAGWWGIRARRSAAAITVVLVLAVGALATPGIRDTARVPLGARLAGVAQLTDRLVHWRAAVAVARDHPVVGAGLDTFRFTFDQKRTPDSWRILGRQTANRAHNAILHVVSTQGLVGVLAVAVIGVGGVVSTVSAWRRAPAERDLVVALAAGLTAFGVQMLFSFGEPGGLSLFITLLALVSALAAPGLVAVGAAAGAIDDRRATRASGASGRGTLGLTIAGAGIVAIGAFAHSVLDRGGFDAERAATVLGVGGAFVIAGIIAMRVDAAEWGVEPDGGTGEQPGTTVRTSALASMTPRAGLWAAALVLAYIVVVRPLQADVTAERALRLLPSAPAEAVERLRRVVDLDGGWAPYWGMLGRAYETLYRRSLSPLVRTQGLRGAHDAFVEASRLAPVDVQHHIDTARVRAMMATHGLLEPSRVFATYDAALRLSPSNPVLYTDAATSALLLGDHGRMVDYAARAVALFPEYGPGHWYLGRNALRENRLEDAARHLQLSLDREWDLNRGGWLLAHDDLSRVLILLGRPREAEHFARIALDNRPDYADARFSLAQALERQGKTEAGIAEYRHILRNHPEHRAARDALRRLGYEP